MSQTLGKDVYSGLEQAQSAKVEAAQQRERSVKAHAAAVQNAEVAAGAAAGLATISGDVSSKKTAQHAAEAVRKLQEEAAAGQHTWLRRGVNGGDRGGAQAGSGDDADFVHGADVLEYAEHVKLDSSAKVALGTTGSHWKRKQQLYVYE